MSLVIPNLDTKDFEQLMKEALAKLPAYNDKWTEYNASDPGITIIELLAWITDVNSYRLNLLGDEHYLAFLKLLGRHEDSATLSRKETLSQLLEVGNNLPAPTHAVTLQDYNYLALHTPDLDVKLARAKATAQKEQNRVYILVIPHSENTEPVLDSGDSNTIKKYLETKKLLTTKICMTKVTYIQVNVSVTIFTKYGDPRIMKEEIHLMIKKFLHPLYGGEDGKGWEFGEDLHISHIYLLLNKLDKVDRIDKVIFENNKQEIAIEDDALPSFGKAVITIYSPEVEGGCDAQ